jgi:hypothetical protein
MITDEMLPGDSDQARLQHASRLSIDSPAKLRTQLAGQADIIAEEQKYHDELVQLSHRVHREAHRLLAGSSGTGVAMLLAAPAVPRHG